MGRAKRRSHGQWCRLLEEQAGGGETVQAFCRRRGLSSAAFYYHKQRARQDSRPSGFHEVGQIAVCGGGVVRIVVADGCCRIEVERGFDAACLREVVQALR